jgi:hypothetical protein
VHDDLATENRLLREENKQLRMKLSAIKVMLLHEQPLCADKLRTALTQCKGCKGENDE